MNYKYSVEVLSIAEVHELPEAWTKAHLLSLLEQLDFDDAEAVPDEELKEMAAMALTDLSPEEATMAVLENRLGDKLSQGRRQALIDDFRGDRVWEEFSEISLHEELFNVACMLHWAFPRKFSEPDAVRIQLKVKAENPKSASNLSSPTFSFIARLLNDGMDEHNTIYRLFDESLASNSFPEADGIIWIIEAADFEESTFSNNFTIYSSWCWVRELKGVRTYESTAFSDGQLH